jgi:hypothetical protein
MQPPVQQPAAAGPSFSSLFSSRPGILVLVLLLLFFAASSDVEQSDRRLVRASSSRGEALETSSVVDKHSREAVREQIILDLSLQNERVEETNRRLRIELLALRRAARDAGLDSLLVNSTLLGEPLGLREEGDLLPPTAEGQTTVSQGGSGRKAGPR